MVRSSKHNLTFSNQSKLCVVSEFVDLYKDAVLFYIDYLWSTRIDSGKYVLDVGKGLYDCPTFLYTCVKPDTRLSARALKCASTQALAVIKGILNKRKKNELRFLWKLSKGLKDHKLEAKLKNPPTKPTLDKMNCDLNSIVSSITVGENSFDFWVTIKSIFSDIYGFKVILPFKNHKQAKKWQEKGKMLNGVSLTKTSITLRYEVPVVEKKEIGEVIAIDQGKVDMLTTSRKDEFVPDKHSWTFSKILDKMARQKWGSKAFQRTQKHRANHVDWLVKQLNLENVKELKLEEVINIKHGKRTSRVLTHWSNPLIRDSLAKHCEEEGVLLTLVKNEFNSQRCHECGWTQKANRAGKVFQCKKCGCLHDADHNAAMNILHRDELVLLPYGFRNLKLNRKGFFWNKDYLAYDSGEEITVPHTTDKIKFLNNPL
jgi:transposase